MKSPFHTEADAFRVLQLTVGGFTAVAIAHRLGGRPSDAILLALVVLGVLAHFIRRPQRDEPAPRIPPPHSGERDRVVVVATAADTASLREEVVHTRVGAQDCEVLLVCPALNSRLAHWVSDVDGAEAAARLRLDAWLGALDDAGVTARGAVGDPDPLQAIEDAMWLFGADELVLATNPPDRMHRLERGFAARAQRRWAVPVTHVGGELDLAPELAAPGGAGLVEATVLAASAPPDDAPQGAPLV
jgi:hypothetical protein